MDRPFGVGQSSRLGPNNAFDGDDEALRFQILSMIRRAIADELEEEEETEGSNFRYKTKMNLYYGWMFPRIPIVQVYEWCINGEFLEDQTGFSFWSRAKELCGIFPRCVVKEIEHTITVKANVSQNACVKILIPFIKEQKRSLHLGLVQITIRPLLRDGFFGVPIKVCLCDDSRKYFWDSLLALVEANLTFGPLYFNCSPNSLFYLSHAKQSVDAIKLRVMTSGIPLVITYRVVCEVTEHPTLHFSSPISGVTTSFQPVTKTQRTTTWHQVKVPDSWILME